MKSRSFYLLGAMSFSAIMMIGWVVWTAAAHAQDVANPSANELEQPAEEGNTAAPGRVVPVPSIDNHPREPTDATQYYSPQYPVPAPPPGQYPTYGLASGNYVVDVAETDPETAKLAKAYLAEQAKIDKLLKQRRETNDTFQSDSLRRQITKATAKQFDLRQQIREREIEQLKKRLADVESTVKKRSDTKDKIVEKRVADLLHEPDQLGWEPLVVPSRQSNAPIIYAPTRVLPGAGVTRTIYSYSPRHSPDGQYAFLIDPVVISSLRKGYAFQPSIDENNRGLRRFRIEVNGVNLRTEHRTPRVNEVRYGWRPSDTGGIDYYVQVDLERLEALAQGFPLHCEVHPDVPSVQTIFFFVGDSPLPRVLPVDATRVVPNPNDDSKREAVGDTPATLPEARLGLALELPADMRLAQTNMTVAEAKARLRVVEAKRDQAVSRAFDDSNGSDLKSLASEIDLAKLVLARIQAEYEARKKLLELDVKQAEANLGEADARYKKWQEEEEDLIKKDSPFRTTEASVRQPVSKARLALERAKIALDLHEKINEPTANPNARPNTVRER